MLRMESLEDQIFDYITHSPARVTFRCLRDRFDHLTYRSLKKAVAALVRSGRLSYTYEFGNSYLVVALDHPVVVSRNVVLKPPNVTFDPAPGQVVVALERGGAFGLGNHPTTRMAIRLIDALIYERPWLASSRGSSALDIGTGSGVLALVAARLGLGAVTAVDTDACAVFEARANVRRNGLDDRVVVGKQIPPGQKKPFDLILANLRMPTLMALRSQIDSLAARDSGIILSGIQRAEVHHVRHAYELSGFRMVKRCAEKSWCALSFVRGARADVMAGRGH